MRSLPASAQANEPSRPEQLDLFATDSPGEGHKSPQPSASRAESRTYQLTELPGETWEDLFGDAA